MGHYYINNHRTDMVHYIIIVEITITDMGHQNRQKRNKNLHKSCMMNTK